MSRGVLGAGEGAPEASLEASGRLVVWFEPVWPVERVMPIPRGGDLEEESHSRGRESNRMRMVARRRVATVGHTVCEMRCLAHR